MPLPLLALAAAAALPKIGLGVKQLIDANNVKLQDTATAGQREMLALARQRAAAGRLPGQGYLYGRLGQNQNATIQNATVGASSGADLLASIAAADRTRANGEVQVGLQGEQANERAQALLGVEVGKEAAQKQRDLAVYNQQKAGLTEGGYKNIANGIDTGAAFAAYDSTKAADAAAGVGTGAVDPLTPRTTSLGLPVDPLLPPGIRGTRLPGYLPRYGSSRRGQALGLR